MKITWPLIFFFIGCTAGDRTLLEEKQNTPIIVIPLSGCPYCIEKAKEFNENRLKSKSKILFIYTGFTTRKDLQLQLGDSLIASSAIIIDSSNQLLKAGVSSMHPTLFYRNDYGKLKELILTPSLIVEKLDSLSKF